MILENNINSLSRFQQVAIKHEYSLLLEFEIEKLKNQNQIVPVKTVDNIQAVNIYYKMKIDGSLPEMYTRLAIWNCLRSIAEQLKPNAGLMIYDTFRTIKTQAALFEQFKEILRGKHPELNQTDLERLTRCYVSHPTDKTHHEIPLHNSGGAVDLTIYDLKTGEPWDFGSDFDDPSEISHTEFFESAYDPNFNINASRWEKVRHNRRTLFYLMKQMGFVNYRYEWWHYDLGDCYWSKVLGLPWFFDSMENISKAVHF